MQWSVFRVEEVSNYRIRNLRLLSLFFYSAIGKMEARSVQVRSLSTESQKTSMLQDIWLAYNAKSGSINTWIRYMRRMLDKLHQIRPSCSQAILDQIRDKASQIIQSSRPANCAPYMTTTNDTDFRLQTLMKDQSRLMNRRATLVNDKEVRTLSELVLKLQRPLAPCSL